MEKLYYANLAKKIDTVIHSAANVKHYGKYEDLKKINVCGTQNVIDFCLTSNNKKLHHVSTLGILGIPLKKWDRYGHVKTLFASKIARNVEVKEQWKFGVGNVFVLFFIEVFCIEPDAEPLT